jgi:hypothetical protein|tara:strand:- start:174 stop:419 length:246 start_codon:yes stop_codon:yes gene_type:complete
MPKSKRKKKTTISSRGEMNELRISYHEKICAERQKAIFKILDDVRKDIKSLKDDMSRGKGAATIIVLLGGILGSIFYYFTK